VKNAPRTLAEPLHYALQRAVLLVVRKRARRVRRMNLRDLVLVAEDSETNDEIERLMMRSRD
jgi:hypothetical protein